MCPKNEANYEHPNWNRSPTFKEFPPINPFYGPQKTLPYEVPYKKI
jgi:hypothetical protein